MKSVLIFLVFAFAVKGEMTLQEYVADLQTKMTDVGLSCAEKLDISDAAMEELTQKKIPTEHDGKCVIHCINTHFGFMNDKGSFDKDKILEFFSSLKAIDAGIYNNIVEVGDICGVIKHDDPCETSAEGVKCTMVEMKKRGVTEAIFEI
nr:uncharacterized protein LOC111415435 [Onthophagus taurus]